MRFSIRNRLFGIALATLAIVSVCALSPMAVAQDAPESDAVQAADSVFDAAHVFRNLPVNVLELLPSGVRSDMLDYYTEADSLVQLPNAMGGLSQLKTVTPDYLKVQITPVSTLQIKLLEGKKGRKVIMTIYTVGDSVPSSDSDIRFFSEDFRELQRDKFIKMPRLEDFFSIPKGSETTMKEIRGMMPFYTVKADAAPGADNLVMQLTPGEYVSVDDLHILELFLKPRLTYIWKGNKFKLEK